MSTCTETAPCFACLRCAIQLANLIPEAAKKAARAHPLGGRFRPAPKQERRYLGASSIPTIYEAFKSHVATLPDGSRVELPAGTVLREAPTSEPTPQENFAALKLMAPSLAGVYERAGVKLGIEPHLVTEEQAYEECPTLRPADPPPTKPRT